MQTFLPYPCFAESASVLDSRRLNKQLLEGRQIYNILVHDKDTGGWTQHPAVLMWKGHEETLYQYLEALRAECEERNIRWQTNWEEILRLHEIFHQKNKASQENDPPTWITDERIYESHQYNLFKKDPDYYGEFKDAINVSCCSDCKYFWPTHVSRNLT